LYLFESSRTR